MADYSEDNTARFTRLGFTIKEFSLLQLIYKFVYAIPSYNLSICEYSDSQTKISLIMSEKLSSNKEFSPIQFFMDIKAYMTFCNEQVKVNPNAPISSGIREDFIRRLMKTDWPPTKWADFIMAIKANVRDLRSDPVFCYPEQMVQKDADIARLFAQLKHIIEISLSCDTVSLTDGIVFKPGNYNIRPDTRVIIFRDHFLAKAHYPLEFISRLSAALAEMIRIIDRNGHASRIGIQTRPVVGKVPEQGFWTLMNSFFNPRPEIKSYKIPPRAPPAKNVPIASPVKVDAVKKVAGEKIKNRLDWIYDFVDEVVAIGAAPGDLKAYDIIKILPIMDKTISDTYIAWPMFKRLSIISGEDFKNFLKVIDSILQFKWELASTQDKVIYTKDVKGQDKLFALNPNEVASRFSEHFNNYFSRYLDANLNLGFGKDIEMKRELLKREMKGGADLNKEDWGDAVDKVLR